MKRLIILLIGLFFIVSCCSVRPGKLTGKWFRSTTCVDDARTLLDYMFTFILMAAFCTKWPMLTELQVLGESKAILLFYGLRISVSCWIVFCCRTAHAVGLI